MPPVSRPELAGHRMSSQLIDRLLELVRRPEFISCGVDSRPRPAITGINQNTANNDSGQ
jgi:hypothetical protein